MPVKRGSLKPEDKFKISSNYTYLQDNFDPVNGALDYMITALVFDMTHDRDKVLNGGEKTARGRTERFIEILEKSGQDAYKQFIAALKETGDEHIAEELENTEVPEANKKEPFAWIDELPDSVKSQCINEGDISRISAVFGIGWQHVFLELKVSQAKIDQAVMSSPHCVSVAIISLLNKWKQKNGSKAHFILLLNAMKRASDRCTIDWGTVENMVEDKSKSAAGGS